MNVLEISYSPVYCKFFPCYVIIGDYLHESDKAIEEVSFVIDDNHALFGSQNSSDNSPIFSVNTSIGEVSARTRNETCIGNAAETFINIRFENSLKIKQVEEKVHTILRFLEIIAGRPQNLSEIKIKIKNNPERLSLYLNTYPGRVKYLENPDPCPCSVLVNATNQPDKFKNLMSKWLDRDEDRQWQIARNIFSDMWNKQRNYDPYRIIAMVIMFEILPQETFSGEIEMSRCFLHCLQEIEELVRYRSSNTELSILERDRILDSLGNCRRNLNVRRLTVKQKASIRLESIIRQIRNSEFEHDLHQLDSVMYKSIDLRNFYIHGDNNRSGRSRERLTNYLSFLTKTLGFVFCVSDLIDSGWDFLSWYRKCKTTRQTRHPFGAYIHNYSNKSQELLANETNENAGDHGLP